MRNLGIAIREGHRAPKGIVNFDNHSRYYDYAPSSRIDSSDEVPGLEYLIDDWDEEQIVLVRSIEDQKRYLIEYQDTLTDWSNLVESNDYVRIAYFDKHDSDFWMGGTFSGTLIYGSIILSTSQTHSGFLLKIAPNGTLLSYDAINNLDARSSMAFAKKGDGVAVAGRTLGTPVEMDGTLYQVQEGLAANLFINPTTVSNISFSTFAFDSSMILEKITCSADGDRITYLLKGTGNISTGQGQIINSINSMVILLTADFQGNVVWIDTLSQTYLVAEKMDIIYGSGHNLIMGLTFLDTFQTTYATITGNGGKDILLAGYGPVGQVIGQLHYGSVDDEDMSQMIFADSILYFGGDFYGQTINRQIGTHKFLNLSNSASNPYISFVHESALFSYPNDFLPKGGNIRPINRTSARTFDRLFAYPNPFSNELLISLHGYIVQNYSIRLVNSLGKVVNEIVVPGIVGNNQFSILASDQMSAGIYFLQIIGSDGFVCSQKVLKF